MRFGLIAAVLATAAAGCSGSDRPKNAQLPKTDEIQSMTAAIEGYKFEDRKPRMFTVPPKGHAKVIETLQPGDSDNDYFGYEFMANLDLLTKSGRRIELVIYNPSDNRVAFSMKGKLDVQFYGGQKTKLLEVLDEAYKDSEGR